MSSIVFLTLNAYDMLVGDGETVGGAQLQQVLLGRELARRGHEVIFIENNGPQKQEGCIDGIRVEIRPSRETGNLRAAPHRVIDLLLLLRRLSPDSCYVRVPVFEMLPTAVYCRLTNTRFIYGFAHDSELTDDPTALRGQYTSSLLYRNLIKFTREQADTLIAQNEYQANRARKLYTRPVVKIPNGYEPQASVGESPVGGRERPTVLWVSELRPWKQPEIVIKTADALPDTHFVIIGPRDENEPGVYDHVEKEVEERKNVCFTGFVPYESIDSYFADADIFLNTSTNEGFPNTFLQAWAYGTPVVSLRANPDGILSDHPIGFCAEGSTEDLIAGLESLVSDSGRKRKQGIAAREYFRAHHSLPSVTDLFEDVITRRTS